MTILISVYDKRKIGSDVLLGTYELDVTSIYFSYQHEFYRVWMALTDPSDEKDGATGHVNATIAVLGPEDELPVIFILKNSRSIILVPKKILIRIKKQILDPPKLNNRGNSWKYIFYFIIQI